MGSMNILAKLEELTGVRPDYQEFHTILLRAAEYYGAPQRDSYGYWAHQNVHDVDALLKEHRARADIDYYRIGTVLSGSKEVAAATGRIRAGNVRPHERRYFLDRVITKIIELEDGEAVTYLTNYSGYQKEKESRLLSEFANYQEQQKKIKKPKDCRIINTELFSFFRPQ